MSGKAVITIPLGSNFRHGGYFEIWLSNDGFVVMNDQSEPCGTWEWVNHD